MTTTMSAAVNDGGLAGRARVAFLAGAAALAMQGVSATGPLAHEGYGDLVEELSPTVVSISVVKSVQQAAPSSPGFRFPENSPFNEWFKEQFENLQPQNPRSRPRMGLGSGFITDASGYIVTNHHVIVDAEEILIRLHDEREFEAELVGSDPKTDIALLKIDAGEPLPAASFGDSEEVRVGDAVLIIGNPHGFGFSVSAGIVSARNRSLDGAYDDFLQTDAAMNVGNSGGPLFNLDGEVIGVNTAIIGSNRVAGVPGSIGIGFSMSSNVVTKVIAQLEEHGTTVRGWLGVVLQEVSADIADAVGLEEPRGAMVLEVPEGPARTAGIRPSDIILSFDGTNVEDVSELVRFVGDASVGMETPVQILRDGEEVTVSVTIGRREEAEQQLVRAAANTDQPVRNESLGIVFAPLSDQARQELGLEEEVTGVLVNEVDEDSVAYAEGIRKGDLFIQFNYKAVQSPSELAEQIQEVRDAGMSKALVLIQRKDARWFVALPVDEMQ